jgi:hypothetical protein
VRCGSAGCGKALATLESIGGPAGDDLVGLLVTADVRREDVVRSDYSGEVKVPMCRRHFQRTDLENDVTYRRIGIKGSRPTTRRVEWRMTFPIAAELFREPVEKARKTRRTQSLVIR